MEHLVSCVPNPCQGRELASLTMKLQRAISHEGIGFHVGLESLEGLPNCYAVDICRDVISFLRATCGSNEGSFHGAGISAVWRHDSAILGSKKQELELLASSLL